MRLLNLYTWETSLEMMSFWGFFALPSGRLGKVDLRKLDCYKCLISVFVLWFWVCFQIADFRMEKIQKNSKESSNTGEDASRNSAGLNLTTESPVPVLLTPEDAVTKSARSSRQIPSLASSRESVSAAVRKLSRFCRGTSGVLSMQEILKEKKVCYSTSGLEVDFWFFSQMCKFSLYFFPFFFFFLNIQFF